MVQDKRPTWQITHYFLTGLLPLTLETSRSFCPPFLTSSQVLHFGAFLFFPRRQILQVSMQSHISWMGFLKVQCTLLLSVYKTLLGSFILVHSFFYHCYADDTALSVISTWWSHCLSLYICHVLYLWWRIWWETYQFAVFDFQILSNLSTV